MSESCRLDGLHLFRPPYRRLVPISHPSALTPDHGLEGAAVVWTMGTHFDEGLLRGMRWRPGGVSLIVVIPPADEIESDANLLRVLELARPTALLPYHQEPNPVDLRALLTEPPEDLPAAVVDYFTWRGLVLDIDTRRLLRRTVELSGELRTVTGLARGVYLSRRALGRRFHVEGLPVPSHWLHFSRLVRALLGMQAGGENLMSVAFQLGYPDGFSLSNQMKRLTGVRPSEAKTRLGWEWFAEAWIQTEMAGGGWSESALEMLQARGSVAQSIPGGGDPSDDPGPAHDAALKKAVSGGG